MSSPENRRGIRGFVEGVKSSVRVISNGNGRASGNPSSGHKRFGRQETYPTRVAEQSARLAYMRETQQDGAEESGRTMSGRWEANLPGAKEDIPNSRLIRLNDNEPQTFVANTIKTSKYNPLSFFPLFLFEMFSRVAYFYFLIQAGLSWWSVVSPFSGVGATMALLFVLLVSAVKAAAEDIKRHKEDEKTNNTKTVKIDQRTGAELPVKWRDLCVGDIIKVKDEELFPADILCLQTGLPDNVCFIRTTNLDGESNLKIRKPVDLRVVPGVEMGQEYSRDKPWKFTYRACLQCESPNGNLHKFKGKFTVSHPDPEPGASKHTTIPVAMSEMLLRGTLLKNSSHVYGLVVYTGPETRIQMNAEKPPLKMGSFDRFLNVQIFILIVAQTVLCILLAIGNLAWREEEGKKRYYLAYDVFVQGNVENGFVYVLLVFLTFWILTSYMVPISLFVTMEIVKFWQAFVFINNDPKMADDDGHEHARARNSGLNEDLGKVEYVFSDKTGTLTSNDMQLRMISIKDKSFGKPDFRLEDQPPSMRGTVTLEQFDDRLAKSVQRLKDNGLWSHLMATGGSQNYILGLPDSNPKMRRMKTMDRQQLHRELNECALTPPSQLEVIDEAADDQPKQACLRFESNEVGEFVLGWHIVDFWTNICVCHSLIIEDRTDSDGKPMRVYQGPSPDEVALVEAGRSLGFEFVERTMDSITLSMQGEEVKFEILNILEFSSDRKRMSVIARAADGTIRLFCKGADNVMLERLKDDTNPLLLRTTEDTLHEYSVKGLRTLVLGTRLLDEEEYNSWDAEYQKAAGSLSADRDARIDRLAEKLEKDFEVVGITAIEDKLQDGVPMAIETLRLAGMKVWMITGDKMETAINIGVSCRLITNQEEALILQADSFYEAEDRLRSLKMEAEERRSKDMNVELVVDGPSLGHIVGKKLERQLAELGSMCTGVVICRSSPAQKASIVTIMKEYELEQAEGKGGPISKFIRRQNRLIKSKMLAIGDGANDVAMIQAADVGIGIMGKEGRQAVNNSDYALGQFRHLVRLLLVHGQLSHYRLARLIKFSFFKNISFAFILIYFQFFCGFSGQTLIDDISAAMYNVVFTSMPILLFAVLDRPLDDATMLRFPHTYNKSTSLSTATFWKTGIVQGMIDGAICFFLPFYGVSLSGSDSTHGLWAVGKTIFVSLLGAVTLEACLIARFWTKLFYFFVAMSYFLVYPFFLLFPYVERQLGTFDPAQFGVAENVFATSLFWFCIVSVYAITFGYRYLNRSAKWLFFPDDNMILAEFEQKYNPLANLTEEEAQRLAALDMLVMPESETVQITDGHGMGQRQGQGQHHHNRNS